MTRKPLDEALLLLVGLVLLGLLAAVLLLGGWAK